MPIIPPNDGDRKQFLTAEHVAHLSRFRIPIELLEQAGVRSVSDLAARELLGVNSGHHGEDLGGIYFQYRHPETGARNGARIRVDNGEPKYLMEQGCRHLFFAPGASEHLRDAAVTAVIVEAEKSALALRAFADRTGAKLLPIAIGGCWGFRRTTGKLELQDGGTEPKTGPSPDFDVVEWAGRRVVIAFDGDAATNPSVHAARRKLSTELQDR